MRGISVPDRQEDFTADPVELFFDLAFVFAFSQLVSHLVHHPDWAGVAEAGLLFGIIWMAWSWFTWVANGLSGNSRLVRSIFVVATAVTVPMAASVTTAFGSGGLSFAVSAAAILFIANTLGVLGHEADSEVRGSALRLGLPSMVFLSLLIVGGIADGNLRVTIWVASLLVIIAGTIDAGNGQWIVRSGHFAERHGLILIIALGEVIVAIGISVVNSLEGGGLSAHGRIGLIAAGVLAGLLWWSYFDRALPGLEHGAEQTPDETRGRYARDVYTYAHAPIIAGIVVGAAAAEEILLHPSDPLPGEFRALMGLGLGLYLSGVAIAVWRAFRAIAVERIAAIATIAGLCLIAGSWAGVWLLVILDIVLLTMLVIEHQRVEVRHRA